MEILRGAAVLCPVVNKVHLQLPPKSGTASDLKKPLSHIYTQVLISGQTPQFVVSWF